jgi:hypothetical protein
MKLFPNRFAALENVDESMDINSAWENIRDHTETSAEEYLRYHRLKRNEPWSDDECSKFTDQRNQVKFQWLQDPGQINGENMLNLRRETNRIIKKKKREYLKDKINKFGTNNKDKNIRHLYRGTNEFKKGYQPRIKIIKNENGHLLAQPQSVLNRRKHFFNQVLNVHGAHDVRQMDIHTAEPLVPEPSLIEVETTTGKLKRYKSPGTDQTPAELIRLIRSLWNKKELPQQWKEPIIVPIYRRGDTTDCNNYLGIFLFRNAYKIIFNILLARLTPYVNEIMGDHQCGFRHNRSTTDHILYIRQIPDKKWQYNGTVYQLFVDFEKACDSIIYHLLLEFGIPQKLVRLIKILKCV